MQANPFLENGTVLRPGDIRSLRRTLGETPRPEDRGTQAVGQGSAGESDAEHAHYHDEQMTKGEGAAVKSRGAKMAGTVGVVFALLGAGVTILYLFQPWRTCPDDDTPAACPMLPTDAIILVIAFCASLVAMIVVIAALAVIRLRS